MQPDPRQLNIFHLATETRDESYKAILKDLTDRQGSVYDILCRGDRCNMEIAAALGWPINRVTGRVCELRGVSKSNPVDPPRVFFSRKEIRPGTNRRVEVWTTRKPECPN
jgi:hypothetical protein